MRRSAARAWLLAALHWLEIRGETLAAVAASEPVLRAVAARCALDQFEHLTSSNDMGLTSPSGSIDPDGLASQHCRVARRRTSACELPSHAGWQREQPRARRRCSKQRLSSRRRWQRAHWQWVRQAIRESIEQRRGRPAAIHNSQVRRQRQVAEDSRAEGGRENFLRLVTANQVERVEQPATARHRLAAAGRRTQRPPLPKA